jgi:hypothetical protein
VYNQNYSDKWKVTIDGIEAKVMRVDHSLMGVHVPSGKHKIHFYYEPGNLLNALLISLTSLLVIGLLYIWLFQTSTAIIMLLAIGLLVSAHLVDHQSVKFSPPAMMQDNEIFNLVDQIEFDTSLNGEVIYDRFLDRGDLERFVQIIDNQEGAFSFTTRKLCPPQTALFTRYLKEHNMITDSSDWQNFQIYHCIPKHPKNLIEMTNRFEATVPCWSNSGVNLLMEENNTYQSLKGTDYGATFQIDLNTFVWSDARMISIEVDYRNQEPIEASLIFSIQDQQHVDLIWKSQEFAGKKTGSPDWQHVIWQLPVQPDWNNARYLNVYIWNKGKTDLAIDNIRVKVSSQGNDH